MKYLQHWMTEYDDILFHFVLECQCQKKEESIFLEGFVRYQFILIKTELGGDSNEDIYL